MRRKERKDNNMMFNIGQKVIVDDPDGLYGNGEYIFPRVAHITSIIQTTIDIVMYRVSYMDYYMVNKDDIFESVEAWREHKEKELTITADELKVKWKGI